MWVRVQRRQAGVEARGVVLGGSGGSWGEGVGQKAGVQLLQVSGSSSVGGAGQVRASGEVRVHPEVASPLKVFPQDLGSLLLIHQPASRRSDVVRPVEGMSHQAGKLLADSRVGARRGRSRRVVGGGRRCCRGDRSDPLCFHQALVLEQPRQVRIGPQRQVRVRAQRQGLPAVLLLLLMLRRQLPPGVPGEAVGALRGALRGPVGEPIPGTHHQPRSSGRAPQVGLDGSCAVQKGEVWVRVWVWVWVLVGAFPELF